MKYPPICQKIADKQIEKMEKLKKEATKPESVKMYDSIIKAFKKKTQKFLDNCSSAYLNDDKCTGTLFESGDDAVIVKKLMEKMVKESDVKLNSKEYNMAKTLILGMRKEMFGKKKDVLKDGFYEKLDKNDVAQLKEFGAKTGCTKVNPFNDVKTNKTMKSITKRFMNVINKKLINSKTSKSKSKGKRSTKKRRPSSTR